MRFPHRRHSAQHVLDRSCRKQHALEEDRKRKVIEKKTQNAELWRSLELLQAQVAEASAARTTHEREQAAADEQRAQHSRSCARVERCAALPRDILSEECQAVIARLRAHDDHAAAREEQERRQRCDAEEKDAAAAVEAAARLEEEEAAAVATAAALRQQQGEAQLRRAAALWGSRFDDECLPDDVLAAM